MSNEGEASSFWTTLPGILTAVGGVVTALTGLLAVLNQMGVIGGSTSDTGGDGDLPSPFESRGMYEMARYLFDPDDCSPVSSGEDAPVAWNLDPQPNEMVKCTHGSYTGVFMCVDTGTVADIQAAYLGKAIPNTLEDVDGPPAGWSEAVDGVQKSFQHRVSQYARVYWDSPARGCAAELQSTSQDVRATVDYWGQR